MTDNPHLTNQGCIENQPAKNRIKVSTVLSQHSNDTRIKTQLNP